MTDGGWRRVARLLRGSRPRLAGAPRTRGRPPSPNGASSFHLVWEVPPGVEAVEAAVTLVVPEVPPVPRLYFWALQVSFGDGSGAHLGLQWCADPDRRRRHVNWGGYGPDGEVLDGTDSVLPSSFDDPNTRDFDWETRTPHRLRIGRGPEGWAGWVDGTLVRALRAPGSTLHSPVMWSEVFADCDDPTVEVRWSEPSLTTASGMRIAVRSATARYQTGNDGGCDNTSSVVEGDAFVQRTAVPRRTPPGTRLSLP